MYIQITTYCNMSCAHCSYSCEAGKKGEHMPLDIYKAALKISGDYITLGGGEPTMHPRFWDYLGRALEYPYMEYVWMATNGSITKRALSLAYMAANGNRHFGVALSKDIFHSPIDQQVIDTFKRLELEVRDVTENVADVGAAYKNNLGIRDECVCPTPRIDPDGYVYRCGCPDVEPIGHVHDDNIGEVLEDWYNIAGDFNNCSRMYETDTLCMKIAV